MDKSGRESMLSQINPAWHDLDDAGVVAIFDGLMLAIQILREKPEHTLATQFVFTYGELKAIDLHPLSNEKMRQLSYGSKAATTNYCIDFEYEHPRFQKKVYDHAIVKACKDANEAEWTVREYVAREFSWWSAPVTVEIRVITTDMPRYSVKIIPSMTELEQADKEIEVRNQYYGL